MPKEKLLKIKKEYLKKIPEKEDPSTSPYKWMEPSRVEELIKLFSRQRNVGYEPPVESPHNRVFGKINNIPKLPPPPSGFQPHPNIIGINDPQILRKIQGLTDLDPRVKEKIKTIQMGPSEDLLDDIQEVYPTMRSGKIPYDAIEDINILGKWDRKIGKIFLNPAGVNNPSYSNDLGKDILSTHAHELTHAAAPTGGIMDQSGATESEARRADRIMGRRYKR